MKNDRALISNKMENINTHRAAIVSFRFDAACEFLLPSFIQEEGPCLIIKKNKGGVYADI